MDPLLQAALSTLLALALAPPAPGAADWAAADRALADVRAALEVQTDDAWRSLDYTRASLLPHPELGLPGFNRQTTPAKALADAAFNFVAYVATAAPGALQSRRSWFDETARESGSGSASDSARPAPPAELIALWDDPFADPRALEDHLDAHPLELAARGLFARIQQQASQRKAWLVQLEQRRKTLENAVTVAALLLDPDSPLRPRPYAVPARRA